jgi:DNA-binding transcriptional MocR family regulator
VTIYKPALPADVQPRYQALADAIERDVAAGHLRPGDRLPPQRELAWRLGITVGTVGRAYAIALKRGMLSAHVGRGTFVAGAASAASDGPVDLARNTPPPGLAPALLVETLKALGPQANSLLELPPEGGLPAHRAAGARWIARSGLVRKPGDVIVTGGVQHGLGLVLASGLAGDTPILLESLTYFGLIDAADRLRQPMLPVPIDAEGLRPDALDDAAKRTGAKLVLLVPTGHNPTTATMSPARRRQIAKVARRRDLILVEDDAYGYLPENRPEPLAALVPERTIYLAGIAKCVTPGLRVGWLSAPPPLLRKLADTQRALCLAPPALPHEVAAQWIEGGGADRLIAWQRAELAERQSLAELAFEGLDWTVAPGVLHGLLHLPTPWSADDFTAEARAEGVLVLPARQFAVGGAPAPDAVRVALGNPASRGHLDHALHVLATLANRDPLHAGAII